MWHLPTDYTTFFRYSVVGYGLNSRIWEKHPSFHPILTIRLFNTREWRKVRTNEYGVKILHHMKKLNFIFYRRPTYTGRTKALSFEEIVEYDKKKRFDGDLR